MTPLGYQRAIAKNVCAREVVRTVDMVESDKFQDTG
jgi:hypothetical protein